MAAPGIWGDEFLVNAVTANAQLTPVVAALAGGRFAIAYTDYSRASLDGFTDFSDTAIRVQVFKSDGTALSSALQVNTVTSYTQASPQISALADGGFVVTFADSSHGWNSNGDDAWAEAVRLQRFTEDGDTLGAEVLVNTTVLGPQDYPCVALLDNGQFIVGWDDGYRDVDVNLKAQRFNTDGSFADSEVMLNAGSAGLQVGCDIAGLPGGGYAVTWVDATGSDGDGAAIMARVFGADGTPLGAEFQVNTATTGDQFQPRITALAGGGFFIAWADDSRGTDTGGDDTSNFAIRGQVFDDAGVKVGNEFRVNDVTTNGQYQPDVLALADGRFIVVYCDTSQGVETGGDDLEVGAIRARIFNADGSPDDDEFIINAATSGHQNEPQLAQLADGRVVVTWTDFSYGTDTGGDDTSKAAIRARILDLRESAAEWFGTAANDDFVGTAWNDFLSGAVGSDTLTGADGDDTLLGKSGDDRLFCGNGADLAKGNDGHDSLYGGNGPDALFGGSGNDTALGGDGDDRIKGNGGYDTLHGDGGEDALFAGRGADVVRGGSGADSIRAGGGKDKIIGGTGGDILVGGKGADSFVFTAQADSRSGSRKRDVIVDFKEGTDRIDLSAIDANPATAGDNAFRFIGHRDFSGTPGEVRYTHNDTRSMIAIDLDGDMSADMKIELTGLHLLKAEDFIL